MDLSDFDTQDFLAYDDEHSPASLPTTLPGPPRMPMFVPPSVSVSIIVPRPRGLALVASNPNPMQTRATVPALRLVDERPSVPPPSIPPTGSTPIRRAA